jgi:catechol 2,3-dioxygenase
MPKHKIAQLAHVELLSPKAEETLSFFVDLLGMQVSHTEGKSVYLRAYQDTYTHSIVVTESEKNGMGHAAFRTESADALEELAQTLEQQGRGTGWTDSSYGQGKTYAFTTPDGHAIEAFWDVERYKPTDEERSQITCAVQKRPLRGVPVRRIDHLNLLAADVVSTRKFFEDPLDMKVNERIELPDGTEMAAWLSFSPFPHEVAIMGDKTGTPGRLHHVAMWYGNDTHLNDCAEALREEEIYIEAGPSKHGITQSPFMYVYEPGGNRIELFGAAGYHILEPDWETRTWTPENLAIGGSMYGLELPPEYFAYGTPTVEFSEDSLTEVWRHTDQVPVS